MNTSTKKVIGKKNQKKIESNPYRMRALLCLLLCDCLANASTVRNRFASFTFRDAQRIFRPTAIANLDESMDDCVKNIGVFVSCEENVNDEALSNGRVFPTKGIKQQQRTVPDPVLNLFFHNNGTVFFTLWDIRCNKKERSEIFEDLREWHLLLFHECLEVYLHDTMDINAWFSRD